MYTPATNRVLSRPVCNFAVFQSRLGIQRVAIVVNAREYRGLAGCLNEDDSLFCCRLHLYAAAQHEGGWIQPPL